MTDRAATRSATEDPAGRSSPPRWKAVALTLPAVDLDGLWAVFNPASGETHLIDGASVAVLEALSAAPADLRILVERLSREHALSDDGLLPGRLQSLLERLDDLGLVERRR